MTSGTPEAPPALISFTDLEISDGTSVQLPPSGIVLIVGPNNAGKSRALREILALCTDSSQMGSVVVRAGLSKAVAAETVITHMRATGRLARIGENAMQLVLPGGGGIGEGLLADNWTYQPQLGALAPYFILHADTESRLSASRPVAALDLYSNMPAAPVHQLWNNPAIEKTLSDICSDAFGFQLMLDRYTGGSHWAIRIGDLPEMANGRPDHAFLQSVASLPLLHEQGDGVRSLVGLLLNWLTGPQAIALIDEPEAFLHPPQAKYLAKLIADDCAAQGRLAFLSTHSSDVVQGALDAGANVVVLRLTRDGSINRGAVIPSQDVKTLWSDSLLRYSNLLEGLFSDGVVVCEADSDCRYFSAVLDSVRARGDDSRRNLDILFTHCGGKHRMHVAVSAMRAAKVPVVAVSDFDILREWPILERLLRSLGNEELDNIQADWNILSKSLQNQAKQVSISYARDQITQTLDGLTGSTLTPEAGKKIALVVKTESGWEAVKKRGLSALSSGNPRSAGDRLLAALKAAGLHVVPVGEIEAFVPSQGGHGPGWVASVLETDLASTSESRTFVTGLAEGLEAAGA